MQWQITIGKFIIVPSDAEKGIINQALLRIRATEKIIPTYLKLCLVDLINTFIRNSHGTGIDNISSIDVLKTFKIFVPNKTIQEKAVKLYYEYEKHIDALQNDNSECEKKMSALFD